MKIHDVEKTVLVFLNFITKVHVVPEWKCYKEVGLIVKMFMNYNKNCLLS